MRFFNRSIFGLFLTVLTIGVLLIAVYVFKNAQDDREDRKRPRSDRERSFSVYVLPLKIESINPEVTVFGEVVSGRTLELRTSAGGKLVQMSENFRKGGTVSEGELLFATDPSSANAEVQLAETDVMEAKAELSEAEDALLLSNDELRAASHQYELRIQAAKRQRSLLKRGVGTEAAVEAAELSASSSETQALSKRQAVANSKARINRAKTSLKRTIINLNESQRKLKDLAVNAGLEYQSFHWAHGLHSPYWWLQCMFWKTKETSYIVNLYHKLLVWDLMKKPLLTKIFETILQPLIGKSLVMYFKKPI